MARHRRSRRRKQRRSRRSRSRKQRRTKRRRNNRSKRRSKRGGLGMHALPLSLFALQRLAMSKHNKKSGKKSRRR